MRPPTWPCTTLWRRTTTPSTPARIEANNRRLPRPAGAEGALTFSRKEFAKRQRPFALALEIAAGGGYNYRRGVAAEAARYRGGPPALRDPFREAALMKTLLGMVVLLTVVVL